MDIPDFCLPPPPTEEPDYIRYGRRYQRPKEVAHPDGESALKAAKAATKGKSDRHLGRARC